MIKIIGTVSFMFFSLLSLAQAPARSSLVVLIVEKATGKPVTNAHFIIKETGWSGGYSAADGKVVLNNNSIPVGEINYVVTRDGYQGLDGRFNITTEVKSNTLRVELTRTPLPESDKVLIRGEVTDKHNQDIAGAVVEVKIGNIIRLDTTDRSGNYLIELELSKSAYPENTVRIEVKDRGCKKVETVSLPRTNVINHDCKLECSESTAGTDHPDGDVNPAWSKNNQPARSTTSSTTTPPPAGTKKETVDGVEITVERCEVINNKLICHVVYRNVGNLPTIELSFNSEWNQATDENGNTYKSEQHVIGNIEGPRHGLSGYDLVKGATVKSRMEFLIGDTNFKKLSRLRVGSPYRKSHNFYDVPVSKGSY